jgi:uncharacterized protein YfaQ (DUF2300 family)
MEKKNTKHVVTEASLSNLNRKGRPPGTKNKSTLVKEAIKEGMEDMILQYGLDVLKATAQQAMGSKMYNEDGDPVYDEHGNHIFIGGSDTCKKMILDRIAPVADMQGGKGGGKTEVVINVQGMQASIDVAHDPVDAEFEEVQD